MGYNILPFLFPQIANENNYGNDYHAKEFGIGVTNQLALVDARVLPAPMVNIFILGKLYHYRLFMHWISYFYLLA